MQVPLELSIRDVADEPKVEELVEARVEKLERLCDHIIGCRVAVERPHRHATQGNPFRVRLDITVPPKHQIVVDKRPGDHDLHDDLRTVINSAFEAAERELRELTERQRGETKARPQEDRAQVVRLFEDEGYGFLKTASEREIYFHRNSVAEDDFDRIEVGTRVRFEEAMGDMGPQATTVQIVDKPGARLPEESSAEVEPPAGWER